MIKGNEESWFSFRSRVEEHWSRQCVLSLLYVNICQTLTFYNTNTQIIMY